MNDCLTTTKQSTTKPCAYFLGYTVTLKISKMQSICREIWFLLQVFSRNYVSTKFLTTNCMTCGIDVTSHGDNMTRIVLDKSSSIPKKNVNQALSRYKSLRLGLKSHYLISFSLNQGKYLSVQGKSQKYNKMQPVSKMTTSLWYFEEHLKIFITRLYCGVSNHEKPNPLFTKGPMDWRSSDLMPNINNGHV